MALITRVSRLFRADFHAVLDRIEEPDVLLKQAVREMEEDVAGDEQRLRGLNQEQAQLARRRDELDDSLRQVKEELDVCFSSGEDDLARVLIRRKLEAQQLLRTLGKQHEIATDTITELNDRLQDNRGRLTAMRQKVDLFTEEDGNTANDIRPEIVVRDEDVEVAFLREKQNRRQS